MLVPAGPSAGDDRAGGGLLAALWGGRGVARPGTDTSEAPPTARPAHARPLTPWRCKPRGVRPSPLPASRGRRDPVRRNENSSMWNPPGLVCGSWMRRGTSRSQPRDLAPPERRGADRYHVHRRPYEIPPAARTSRRQCLALPRGGRRGGIEELGRPSTSPPFFQALASGDPGTGTGGPRETFTIHFEFLRGRLKAESTDFLPGREDLLREPLDGAMGYVSLGPFLRDECGRLPLHRVEPWKSGAAPTREGGRVFRPLGEASLSGCSTPRHPTWQGGVARSVPWTATAALLRAGDGWDPGLDCSGVSTAAC